MWNVGVQSWGLALEYRFGVYTVWVCSWYIQLGAELGLGDDACSWGGVRVLAGF